MPGHARSGMSGVDDRDVMGVTGNLEPPAGKDLLTGLNTSGWGGTQLRTLFLLPSKRDGIIHEDGLPAQVAKNPLGREPTMSPAWRDANPPKAWLCLRQLIFHQHHAELANPPRHQDLRNSITRVSLNCAPCSRGHHHGQAEEHRKPSGLHAACRPKPRSIRTDGRLSTRIKLEAVLMRAAGGCGRLHNAV